MIDVVDFMSITPFYDAHLVRALQRRRNDVRLLAVSPYADWSLYRRFGLRQPWWTANLTGLARVRKDAVRRTIALADYAAGAVLHAALGSPTLVHVQWLPLTEFTRNTFFERKWMAAWKRRRVPIVITVHNVLPHDQRVNLDARARLLSMADALICHTAAAREEVVNLLGTEAPPVHVIPHGPLFEDDAATTTDPDPNLVAAIGTIKPYKGIPLLLAAWPEVLRRRPSARLVVAGMADSGYAAELRNEVQRRGIAESVTIDVRTLSNAELIALHHRAAVVVFPYEAITQSGALLTAMTFGKAIVATELAAFAETLGDAAAVVPKESLASAIAELLADPDARRRLGDAARARVVSWDEIARQTLAIYDALESRR